MSPVLVSVIDQKEPSGASTSVGLTEMPSLVSGPLMLPALIKTSESMAWSLKSAMASFM